MHQSFLYVVQTRFFWNWVKHYLGPVAFMELSEKAEKTGRKRRRKRIKPIPEEEEDGSEVNFLKRKPTAPVKPPVSKKAFVPSENVTNLIVLDSGPKLPDLPEVGRPLREDEITCANYEANEAECLIRQEKEERLQKETDEALKQLLKQLDEMEERYFCPIHQCAVERVDMNGDSHPIDMYYRCPESKCIIFCSEEAAPHYFGLVNEQLLADYKHEERLPRCYCNEYPVLKVSKTEKNYDRMYIGCGQKEKCNFFQWADSPLTYHNKKWMGWNPEKQLLHPQDPSVDGEGVMKVCPIHRVPLEVRVASSGWEYCKCSSDRECMLFCGKKEARYYMNAVQARDKFFVGYKYEDHLPVCFCRSVPVLKVSGSEKNNGRLYMSCNRKNKCDFFQWADVPLFDKNREWMQSLAGPVPPPEFSRTEENGFMRPNNRDRPLMVEDKIIVGPDDCPFRGLLYSADMEQAWARLRRLYERASLAI